METPVSLPDKLFIRAEEYAKEHGLSRNEPYAKAVSEYIRRKNKRIKNGLFGKSMKFATILTRH